MEERRGLYRSRTDSVIGGVSGGIANYLNTDPTIIRILFVLLAIFGGGGVLIYLILWIAVPIEPAYSYQNMAYDATNKNADTDGKTTGEDNKSNVVFPKKQDGSLIAGLVLIAIGVVFLVDRFIPHIDFDDLWPIILLVAGIALIRLSYTSRKKDDHENPYEAKKQADENTKDSQQGDV